MTSYDTALPCPTAPAGRNDQRECFKWWQRHFDGLRVEKRIIFAAAVLVARRSVTDEGGVLMSLSGDTYAHWELVFDGCLDELVGDVWSPRWQC